jgi:aspartyl-tRNA(Asn)/glutamyl-tRNA(Gln) amidotransferase subunit A
MAELGPEIFFATVVELGAKIADKQISAEELVRAFANRLEQLGPRYNALALPLPEQAIRAAKVVDQDIKRGRLRGPLQGIPYAVKDLPNFAAQITT